jgi:membrane protease YdiL (CAAX protease family)
VAELNNPLPALKPELSVVDRPDNLVQLEALSTTPPLDPINPYAEDPPWTGLDLFLMLLVMFAALYLFSVISLGIGTLFTHSSFKELSKDPGVLFIIPPTGLAYLVVMIFMCARLKRVRHVQFWQAVSWRWPKGQGWLGFLFAGFVTSIALSIFSRLLPIPKSLPVDRFFADRKSAYLMAFFGVLVAPLIEELLFRGFLYPVLDRWLQTLFMLPQSLRRGSLWICIIAGWGFVKHKVPSPWSGILTLALFLAIVVLFLSRSTNPGGKPAHLILLPGVSLLVWGVLARSLPGRESIYGAASLLVLALLVFAIGAAPALRAWPASKIGRGLAMLITAAAFAMMHSLQLGGNWAALLVLFGVSCVLTVTRVVTRAVAPGVLIHVGYNALIFSQIYVVSDHFRDLEKLAR